MFFPCNLWFSSRGQHTQGRHFSSCDFGGSAWGTLRLECSIGCAPPPPTPPPPPQWAPLWELFSVGFKLAESVLITGGGITAGFNFSHVFIFILVNTFWGPSICQMFARHWEKDEHHTPNWATTDKKITRTYCVLWWGRWACYGYHRTNASQNSASEDFRKVRPNKWVIGFSV